MRLYGTMTSAATYRVRIALSFKGFAAESVAIDLRQGEQRTLTYLARNPQGLAPLLEEGELRLWQSLAILEHLEESCPEPPLLPRDGLARARVRAFALSIVSDIHPLTTRRVLSRLRSAYELSEGDAERWARHWLVQGLGSLESEVQGMAGSYAFGDEVTFADVCLVPQLFVARRHRIDLKPYPTLRRIEQACLGLPAFEAAHPERQPEPV